MAIEGLCTEETGPSTFHQLRGAAMEREWPYGGPHPRRLPGAVADEIADLWAAAAAEAERMGWPGFHAECTLAALIYRTYADASAARE